MTSGITLYSQTNLKLISFSQMIEKRYDCKDIRPTVKHEGGCVMVWGHIAATGVGELVIIDKIMDKHLYLNILKENLQKKMRTT